MADARYLPVEFYPGRIAITSGAGQAFEEALEDPYPYLDRHCTGDWGDVDDEDKHANDAAVENRDGRILSAYTLPTGARIWILTERDRSVTTLLTPDEYEGVFLPTDKE
jgi:hypothetical protein